MIRPAAILFLLCMTLPVAATANPASSAIQNQPRIWSALSGNRMQIDGYELRLRGVTCAAPATDAGRNAKALLNTFLRAGHVRCRVTDDAQATCTVNGQSINEQMQRQPGCWSVSPPARPSPDGHPDPAPTEPPFQDASAPKLLERKIRPADPLSLWRRASEFGPAADHERLILYSLRLLLHNQGHSESGDP